MAKKDSIFIAPNRMQKEYLKDLFRYKELFYFFAWRDILVRYKQTVLGVIWALFRPLLNVAVFAFIFGKVAGLSIHQANYPLFVLAGLLPWQLFAGCIVDASNSLVNNAPMISKVYFPRLILPVSYILVNVIDFLIGLSFFCLLLPFFNTVSFSICLLPLCILQTLLFCLGVSFWLAALTVRYRDFRFIVPFAVQFGMFISPVGYSSFLIPEPWRWLYFLNPMAGVIEGYRWSLLGIYHPDLPAAFLISSCVSIFLLVTGFRFFRKMECLFADII